MNTRSIHFRLIMWYSSLVALVALAFAAYIYHGLETRLYAMMERNFVSRAHRIADVILRQDKSPQEIARQITEVYAPEANNRFIRILRNNHSILYISGIPKDGSFAPGDIRIKEGQVPTRRIERLSYNISIMVVAVPVVSGDETYTIEIGAATDDIETALQGLLVILKFGVPFIILIVSIGGYILVRKALGPVEDMTATAEQITFGNLSNRLPVAKTGDELEHLSVTLNQMLARLEGAYQQASRFSADASHELRTPLAIMRGELESMAQEETLPENMRERVSSVLEETDRLSRIAENLLTISRLDDRKVVIEYTHFDLAVLAKNIAEQITLLAEEKKIKITVAVADAAPIYGDPAKLKQVIVNLLDNAIKYTLPEGTILLGVYSAQNRVHLEVIDNGIGISKTHLPHVFERFFRADKSRSRQGGAGLGLSIVHSICQAHGGSVYIKSEEGKGTTCHVELPLENQQKSNGQIHA